MLASGSGGLGAEMERIEPSTFVLGVVPFLSASNTATDEGEQPKAVDAAQLALPPATVLSPTDALAALVRLLARQAATEAFATRCSKSNTKEPQS